MTGLLNPKNGEGLELDSLDTRVMTALEARIDLFDERHQSAFRLFNGFYEGNPDLVVDLFARTLLIYNYAKPPQALHHELLSIQELLLSKLPWVNAVIHKVRYSNIEQERRGILFGKNEPDRRIYENGVWYAVDLRINQDASIYLDTRNLRGWLKQNLAGKTLLNTFAYTGSYGVAAQAGGARRVVYLDLSRKFLNIAKTSYSLNGFPIQRQDFMNGDFWTAVNQLKRRGEHFDCVIIDPPIFSKTGKGTIDLKNQAHRVINKVRPLINDGGYLIAINNGLFVSGEDYVRTLEELCADGYLTIEALIPVPPDFTGYSRTLRRMPPADPAPFNHPTKIAILRVRRKSVDNL